MATAMIATQANGIALQVGDGADPEVFTTIAEVISVNPLSASRTAIDVTSFDSAGNRREFVGGLVDNGECSFTIQYDATEGTHDESTGIISFLDDTETRSFQMVYPDSATTTQSFKGIVTGFSVSAVLDDKITADVTLKISGVMTFA